MPEKIYIYGLYDPFTSELRYVGKTKMTLARRLWHHVKEAKTSKKNTYKLNWIRNILDKDGKPIIHILRETNEENWREDEAECISEAFKSGTNLTNLTAGGDGLVDFHHSEETKNRISEHNKKSGKIPPSWKGRNQSSEHIRKRVETRKKKGNYSHSQETKDLISRKNTGKNLGNTHTLGYKHTDKWKEEMSQRNSGTDNPFYGRQHSDESKQKISKSKKGTKLPSEIRAKLSKAQRARAKRDRDAHVAKISISYDELIAISDDLQIKEIYRLYIIEGLTKREIMEHLGYKGAGGNFYSKMSKAIKAIPTVKTYRCPNCKAIWTEFDLMHSEGNCLTEPELCGWEDELEEVND